MPAAGFPVASRTTSIPELAIIAAESVVITVFPVLKPSTRDILPVASYFSGGHPVLSSADSALSGARSAMAANRIPLVWCDCEML